MKNKYLTDASMIAAIFIVLLMLSRLTGGALEELLAFILPIPVALYTLKYDYKKGILPAVSIILISFFIINPIKAVCYIMPANIVGLFYGEVLKKKVSTQIKILIAVVGAIIVNVLATVIFAKVIFGYSIVEDTKILVQEAVGMFESFNISSINIEIFEAIMIGLIPSIIICTSIMEGILTHLLTSLMAKRVLSKDLGGAFVGLELSVPKLVTYIVTPILIITGLFLTKINEFNGELPILLIIGINISFIFMILYILEGLVVISLYAKKSRASYLLIFAAISIFIFPFFVIIVGILDSFFDMKTKILFKNFK